MLHSTQLYTVRVHMHVHTDTDTYTQSHIHANTYTHTLHYTHTLYTTDTHTLHYRHTHYTTDTHTHTTLQTHIHYTTDTHRHTNTHMHTHKNKPYGSHAKHSFNYCLSVNQHWDAYAPLEHLSLVQANPPGEGLVTHRRSIQVPYERLRNPELHNDPNTIRWGKDNWAFTSPVYTRYPLMFTAGWAAFPVSPSHQMLDQCESSFLLKKSATIYTIMATPAIEVLNQQPDALTT